MSSILVSVTYAIFMMIVNILRQCKVKLFRWINLIFILGTIAICLWMIVVALALTAKSDKEKIESGEKDPNDLNEDILWGISYIIRIFFILFIFYIYRVFN